MICLWPKYFWVEEKSATQQKKLQFEVYNDIIELVLNSRNFALNKWVENEKILATTGNLKSTYQRFWFYDIIICRIELQMKS